MSKKSHTLGSGPSEEAYLEQMKRLAHAIDTLFNGDERPGQTGFVLMVFPFSSVGRCNYISNAERRDIVTLLKEQLAYFEGQPDNIVGYG